MTIVRRTFAVAALRRFAEEPIEYEVRMLLSDAWALLDDRPDGVLGPGLRHNLSVALLEAWLVHIRLLDDFLRHGQSKDGAAIARDWQPRWSSNGFLTNEHRQALSDQITHLTWQRQRWTDEVRPPWEGQIRPWTDACCEEMLRFFDSVPEELGSAFDVSRAHIDEWLRLGAARP